ncbi:MAG: FAD-dependent oxidoreductase, partial [Actinomycetota bacterium]
LRRDGEQLGEVLAFTLEADGNRTSQLHALRQNKDLSQAWITRPSYTVLHLGLAAEQARKNLEAVGKPGLFFAGRAAGSCNYTEAAALGIIAGINAAHHAGHGAASRHLSFGNTLVGRLLDRVAHKNIRPVTVRIDDESGC